VRLPPARKRFAQHFLEPAWAAKVVHAIDPRRNETFLEIGPGRGALTRPLAEHAGRVIAYEIDRDLAATLRLARPRVIVVEGDFLDATPQAASAQLDAPILRFAGNLPYNVASPIVFKLRELFEAGVPFVDATVMLQLEVADRLVACPGHRDYGVLSVLIQLCADVERLLVLPPNAFRPAPRVRSALVRIRFHEPRPKPQDRAGFERLVHKVFTRRRKTIANALLALPQVTRLVAGAALRQARIDGRRRPEALTITELVALSDALGAAVL
jgi:16S rRNA (adenine1518-N6/adenine1519-N6)-dimethyltransferase